MIVENKFTFTAGILIRGDVVSQMKNAAFNYGVEISVDEDRGWTWSNYRVTLRGEKEKVDALQKVLNNWFRRLEHSDAK